MTKLRLEANFPRDQEEQPAKGGDRRRQGWGSDSSSGKEMGDRNTKHACRKQGASTWEGGTVSEGWRRGSGKEERGIFWPQAASSDGLRLP